MPQVTLDIPKNKYAFFMELVRSLPFIKKVKEQKDSHAENDADDYTSRTKEELLADFREALEEVKLIREGKKRGRPAQELINELRSNNY